MRGQKAVSPLGKLLPAPLLALAAAAAVALSSLAHSLSGVPTDERISGQRTFFKRFVRWSDSEGSRQRRRILRPGILSFSLNTCLVMLREEAFYRTCHHYNDFLLMCT